MRVPAPFGLRLTRRWPRVLLVLALGILPRVAAAGVVLRMAPEVSVRTDEIRLGDVAEIEGSSPLADRLRTIRLGQAPPVGTVQRLDLESLRLRLKQHQIDPTKVEIVAPDRVIISRAAQVVTGLMLLEAATRRGVAHLEALDPHGGPFAVVPVSRPSDLRVPSGATELVAKIDASPPYAALSALVSVRVDGRETHVVPLSFRVGRHLQVVVATRALETSAGLAVGDVALESRVSTEIPAGALDSIAELADMELTRALKAGEVVTRRALRPKLMVRRGDLVTLSYVGRGFRVTTLGRAIEDARRGASVRVLNPTSKREVLGTAEAPGLVRIGGER